MNRTKAFAVICVLLVSAGSLSSFAVATGSSGPEIPPAQIAVSGQTESVDVTILPETHRVLRDQPITFVVRIVSDNRDAIFLGFEIRSDAPVSFEFHNPDVQEMPRSWLFPRFDVLGYIPSSKVDTDEYVPVTLSPDEKFPHEESAVGVNVGSRVDASMVRTELTFQTRCPLECRAELFAKWSMQDIELLIALAGLLIAFFGRKRIWAVLRASRHRVSSTVDGRLERDE